MKKVIEFNSARPARVSATPRLEVVEAKQKKVGHSPFETVRRFRDHGTTIEALAVTHPRKRRGVQEDIRNALLGRLYVPLRMAA